MTWKVSRTKVKSDTQFGISFESSPSISRAITRGWDFFSVVSHIPGFYRYVRAADDRM